MCPHTEHPEVNTEENHLMIALIVAEILPFKVREQHRNMQKTA